MTFIFQEIVLICWL